MSRIPFHQIAQVAHECAKRVMMTGRAESLTAMNSYERRLVHTELASYTELETSSIGNEPNRRVVIAKRAIL